MSPDPLHPKCQSQAEEGWQPCWGGTGTGISDRQESHSWSIFPGNCDGFMSEVATLRPCHHGTRQPQTPWPWQEPSPTSASLNPILGFVGAAPQPHGALALLSLTPLRGRVTPVPGILPRILWEPPQCPHSYWVSPVPCGGCGSTSVCPSGRAGCAGGVVTKHTPRGPWLENQSHGCSNHGVLGVQGI